MSKKKVTAPLSYDPGKGRPKEYLAYLNWQEMEALRRLNGNNMERGPMGLPSFPPDWSGSDSSTGNWSGAGGSTTGAGTGGGSDSGASDSGGSIGSTTSPGATASTTGTTAGTQSSDTAAQQAAEVKNAADAARTSALTEDARKAGIGSINVGPMHTPVRIGSGTISQAVSSAAPTMPGGGGMGQYNARRGSSTMAVGPTSGVDAFNNIATGSLYGTQPRAARAYDSLESDLNRRALTRAMGQGISTPPITQNAPGGVFGPRQSMDRTYYPDAPSGATIGPRKYSAPSLFETDNYTPEFDGIGGPTDRQITNALKSKAYDAYSAVSNYFSGQPPSGSYDVSSLPKLELATPEVRNAQSMRVVGGLGIASLPGNIGSPSTQTVPSFDSAQRDLEYGGGPKQTKMASIDRMGPFNPAHDLGRERVISVEDFPDGYENSAEKQIGDVEEEYRNQPGEGVYSVGEIMREGDLPYPTHSDGSPITAEDIAGMPYETQSEIMDKARFERMTDEEYKLTPEQKQQVAAVKFATAPTRNIVTKAILAGIGGIAGLAEKIPGGVGEAASTIKRGAQSLADPAEAMADYFRLDPLQKQQFAERAGKKYNVGSGATYASGTPTQEPGGKGNDFGPSSYGGYSGYSGASYTPSSAAEETGRPQQYYLWDLGVGIPSPGDPDYNEYQKYRRNRGSSANV
jgi:hypothetical protein